MQNFIDPKQTYFTSQVHQPFFVFGILNLILYMALFALNYRMAFIGNALFEHAKMFHAYSMTYVVLSQFFIGFLFTPFPKFLQTAVIEKAYYMRLFYLYQVGSLLYIVGQFTQPFVLFIAMGILVMANGIFVYTLMTLYRDSSAANKTEPFWMLVSVIIGFILHVNILAQELFTYNIHSFYMAFYLYLVLLTFIIASKMVPFFSHSLVAKSRYFFAVVVGGFIAKVIAHFYMPIASVELLIDVILGSYILYELRRWQLNTLKAIAIVKVLHVSLYWIPISLLFGALEHLYPAGLSYLQIHMFALGFIVSMLIGFGTRVTLGHSGHQIVADSASVKLFYMTQLVVIVRILFSVMFEINVKYIFIFDISVTLFLLMFILWALKFAPILLYGKKS